MNKIVATRDPGRYAVDYGHVVETIDCVDEAAWAAAGVHAGIRRAEEDRQHAAEVGDDESEALPSEIFFG